MTIVSFRLETRTRKTKHLLSAPSNRRPVCKVLASSRLLDGTERTIGGRITGICTNVNSRKRDLFFSIAESEDEAEAGPGFVDGTNFVVDETVGQSDRADDVLSEIGRDSRGAFRPGDPEPGVVAEGLDGFRKFRGQLLAAHDERDHEIERPRVQR